MTEQFKTLSSAQHDVMELVLDAVQMGPLTAKELYEAVTAESSGGKPTLGSFKQRVDRFVEWGWLERVDRESTGQRGAKPYVYAPAPGALEEWDRREVELQKALKEQRKLDDALLG
jgi:hypothetical protein